MEATEEPVTTAGEESEVTFTVVDYTLFSLLLVASFSIGVISTIRNRDKKSTQEFLLGGRTMSPVAVLFSLIGGRMSAISMLGCPTEMYFFGTQFCMTMLSHIPGGLFVGTVVIPIFSELKLVSINEYIQLRYGSRLMRLLTTLCCLLTKFGYMGMNLYAPSLALSTVTGIPTWVSTILTGSISTFYITIGGTKAVVYTDVLQTLVMFGGVLVVVIICCIDLGGVGNVWAIADQGGRIQFFNLDTSPYERHTLLSTLVYGFYMMFSSVGVDQVTYQRLASVRTLQISQRLVAFFILGIIVLSTLYFFSGLVAFAVYTDCDPLTSGKIEKPDQILPFLVTDKLSHLIGMAGIYVASIYSGVLSTLSSCGNSVACLIWEDFLKERPYFSRLSDAGATNVIKLLSFLVGVAAICIGLLLENMGSILYVYNSIISAVTGPLVGIYLTGICAPWVNWKGAVTGFTVAFGFNIWLVTGKFLTVGGTPTLMPLSTVGCQDNLANATIGSLINNTTLTDIALMTTALPDVVLANITVDQMYEPKTIYDISYCYAGPTGVAITLVVSTFVSLFTGPNSPTDLREGVVYRPCARAYQSVWLLFKGCHTSTSTSFPPAAHSSVLHATNGITATKFINTPTS